MKNLSFGENGFRLILETLLDNDYRFLGFGDQADCAKIVYLRHDVDISPFMAMDMGEIMKGYNVKSNFFFQLNSETYNTFSPETLQIMSQLKELGHSIGLHMDERFLGANEEKIKSTIEWFGTNILKIDNVVSFHRPSPSVIGLTYENFLSTYSPQFFKPELYFSDSRRRLDFWPDLLEIAENKSAVIQLLLHPVWWRDVGDVQEVWTRLSRRCDRQLSTYMRTHFPRVFSDIIEEKIIEDNEI